MGRGAIVFMVVLSIVAVQFMMRRKSHRKDLVGRMSNTMSDLSKSKPVETLVDEVDDLLKEIRKQIKR
jgi:hypothetical protein